ncbi:MAG: hypothetical protein HQM13_00595 [SAR324 cluster bacterium]|nr:hypothetical protein [SAR324 cluster bacterium]
MNTFKKGFFLASLAVGIVIIQSCASTSERFRTRSLTDHSIKYKSPVKLKVTGIGCALDSQRAVQKSRSTADYNLRSILGNRRYLTSFREIDRYEENGQICVETEVESRSP